MPAMSMPLMPAMESPDVGADGVAALPSASPVFDDDIGIEYDELVVPAACRADEIIEIARLHGVDLTVVVYRQDLLTKYQGVAAQLYAPLGEA